MYMCTVRILMYVLNVLYMQRWESMHITYECNSKCKYVHYATMLSQSWARDICL